MPLAVTKTTEHCELKTVPGGYVVVRRLSHGEKQERRTFGSKMEMQASSRKDLRAEIDMFNAQAENYDLAKCVVEHNLTYMEDGNEVPLDFKNPSHLRMIDGIVIEEIGTLIDKINNFEDDETVKKSSGSLGPA
jgi:hypothetical protein